MCTYVYVYNYYTLQSKEYKCHTVLTQILFMEYHIYIFIHRQLKSSLLMLIMIELREI